MLKAFEWKPWGAKGAKVPEPFTVILDLASHCTLETISAATRSSRSHFLNVQFENAWMG